MSGLPIVLTVKGRPTLVVGGKDRAVPKVRRLLTAGAAVCVVAPAAGPEIVEFADQGRLVWRKRAFVSGDVRGLSVVFGATGGIGLVYFLSFILGFFGSEIPLIHSSGTFGILFSLFVVVIAALN